MSNLRQCFNALTVVGTVKSKEVKYGNLNGDTTISVDLLIASKEDDKIHENKIRLWAKSTSKLYNSYVTVANEYKSMNEHGADADRVRISGSLEMNEYLSGTELKTYNNLKGVFVNRLDKDLKDEVGAVVECVVTGISDEINKDGMPTGRKKVQIMTVGYNSSIHEIQNVIVEKELAAQFVQMYPVNSTGKLYLKVNNYEIIDETKQEDKPNVGFGNALSNMPDSIAKDYVREVIIVGGDAPNIANRFTLEQIEEIKKQRELSRNEKLNSAPSQSPSGFGNGFNQNSGNTQNNQGGFNTFGSSGDTMDDDNMPF